MNSTHITEGKRTISIFLLVTVLLVSSIACGLSSAIATNVPALTDDPTPTREPTPTNEPTPTSEPTSIPRTSITIENSAQIIKIAALPGYGGVLFSPNGKILANNEYDNVKLYDVDTQAALATLTDSSGEILDMLFDPDGQSIIVFSRSGEGKKIQQWNLSDLSEGSDFAEINKIIELEGYTIAISPDGKWLALETCDEGILSSDGSLYCSSGGISLHRFDNGVTTSPSQSCNLNIFRIVLDTTFNADGTRLAIITVGSTNAIGYDYGTVNICDPGTGNVDVLWAEFDSHPTAIAFTPDGKSLAAGMNDGKIIIFDLATRQSVRELQSSVGIEIQSIAFSPDGSLLVSGDESGDVRLWNVKSGDLLADLDGDVNGVNQVSFNLDGTLIASAGNSAESLILWGLPLK